MFNRRPRSIIAGIGAAVAIGAGYAVATHNYVIGLALGVVIAAGLTVGLSRRSRRGK